MTLWDQIRTVLAKYEDTEMDRQTLRELVRRMPTSLDDASIEDRGTAQSLGAEALYQVGDLERAIEWASPPRNAESALWLGYALFDAGRYDEALPAFEKALTLPLLPWLQVKLEELSLCCRLYQASQEVALEDFVRLHEKFEALGDEAAVPSELFRAFRSIPSEEYTTQLRRARALFAADFASAGLGEVEAATETT